MKKKELNIILYKKLYLIRKAEEEIIKYYHEDEMKTPMHMSIGSEAISVGVCQAIGKNGQVVSSYRSHAVYLSKTGETDKFFAELYGRESGVAKGKAGSMHLSSPENGFLSASAIVASTIPLALGAAYANKRLKKNKIVVAFFGDGATNEGVFWESINIASLMKLPLIFICEDNDLAIHVPRSARQGYSSITDIVSNYRCNVEASDTTDAEEIYNLTKKMMSLHKKNGRPGFLHLRYFRYLEHVGINEDFNAGYRKKEDSFSWKQRDPIRLQRNKFISLGVGKIYLKKIEETINRKIEKSIQKAKNDKYPDNSELYRDMFSE